MSVPNFQTIMIPLLQFHANKRLKSSQDCLEHLSVIFKLSGEDLDQRLPSGAQRTFENRVSWASGYLCRTKLLDCNKKGMTRITAKGLEVLTETKDHNQ